MSQIYHHLKGRKIASFVIIVIIGLAVIGLVGINNPDNESGILKMVNGDNLPPSDLVNHTDLNSQMKSDMTKIDAAGKIAIYSSVTGKVELVDPVVKTEAEWQAILPPRTFEITRRKSTETPFTGEYYNTFEDGIYQCSNCGTDLFDSKDKYESETGWPSFTKPIAKENINTNEDTSLGMIRIEATCARCGAHLGHIFDDGPPPSHLRYCMNSAALKLRLGAG